jgi:hypothetical protein
VTDNRRDSCCYGRMIVEEEITLTSNVLSIVFKVDLVVQLQPHLMI